VAGRDRSGNGGLDARPRLAGRVHRFADTNFCIMK
jgi:hypothetical protein